VDTYLVPLLFQKVKKRSDAIINYLRNTVYRQQSHSLGSGFGVMGMAPDFSHRVAVGILGFLFC